MFMPQARTRQDHGGESGVIQVDRETRGNQLGFARRQHHRRIDARTQVEAGGSRRGVGRQWKFLADAGVEDADFQCTIRTQRRRRSRLDDGVHAVMLASLAPDLRSA